MSSFVGTVLLGSGESLSAPPSSPPDEPGLESCTRHEGLGWAIRHRLRVVTPEDRLERQPLPAWGDGWVCFAGRLDDLPHLASALNMRSAGMADGALACRALERWDCDAPARLIGDYALAAWHHAERRLILAADPQGMRSMYYWRKGDTVIFSTTLHGLLAMPQVSRAIDQRHVADYLAMNYGDADTTFYRDIRKVVPGTCVVITQGSIRAVEAHRFDPERRIRLKDDGAYVETARALLDQAVADRLRAVGPVPISVSGGLDSACVAASVHTQAPSTKLLTAMAGPGAIGIRKSSGYTDERPLVEILACAFPGLDAEFHVASPNTDWSPDSRLSTAHSGAPYRNPAHLAWFGGVYRRAEALGAHSILTGNAGNMTLTWDGRRGLLSALRQGKIVHLARELAMESRGSPRTLAGTIWKHLVLPLKGQQQLSGELRSYSALSPQAMREFDILDRMRARGNDTGFVLQGDSRRMRIQSLLRSRHARSDVMNMLRGLYGLDILIPLNDVRLVEFCLAIPEEQFLKNGTDRYLARRLLRRAGVPRAITENRQRGRQHPEWFAHMTEAAPSFPAQMERLRRSPTVGRLIDLDRLDHLIDAWPANAQAAERQRKAYGALMNAALSVGAFIAWAEGTN